MSFYQKFELLALLRDDGVKTFVARENSTGRALEAHLFTGGKTAETIALLDRIGRLSL